MAKHTLDQTVVYAGTIYPAGEHDLSDDAVKSLRERGLLPKAAEVAEPTKAEPAKTDAPKGKRD